jgi:hypothetical protein
MQESPTVMHSRKRGRSVSIALIILAAAVGLGSRRFALMLPDFIAAYTGDVAWALAVFLGLGVFFPSITTGRAALVALLISIGVELSQLYHARWIDAIRGTTLGHLALGSGFDPRDLACYTVGVAIGVVIRCSFLGGDDGGLAVARDQSGGQAVDRPGRR